MFQAALPFLLNFGINKAMGMSTGKALGLAGLSTFLPGSQAAGTTGGASGGIGGLIAGEGARQTGKAFALEGAKTLAAGMAEKKYGGAAPFIAYGGLTGLQGGLGMAPTGGEGLAGAKQAFLGAPETAQVAQTAGDEILTAGIDGGLPSMPPSGQIPESQILETIKPGPYTTTAAKEGLGMGTKLALGATALPLLSGLGGDDAEKPTEKLNINYPSVKDIVTRFKVRDYDTGQDVQVPIGETVEERIGTGYQPRFKEGGLAQFNNGALVSKLPSKTTNDEKDYSVYRRASNFVVDESGNGNGDEDTMLAQLADGEFVTTAKAVLGAGIMAGANPSDANQMRDKGAKYFYEQQARFKRIFEMLKKAKAA